MSVKTGVASLLVNFEGVNAMPRMGWESKIVLPEKFPEAVCYLVYMK